MCKIVSCGSKAQFGIKDGRGCQTSDTIKGLIFGDIKNVKCEYTGGYCAAGAQKDCTWTVPSPQCPIISTTETPTATTDIQCLPETITNILVPYDAKKCKMKGFSCGKQQLSLWIDEKCGCGCIPQKTVATTSTPECVPELSTNILIPYDEQKCKKKRLSCYLLQLSFWTDEKCGCGCIPQVTTECVPELAVERDTIVPYNERKCKITNVRCVVQGLSYWSDTNCGCGCENATGQPNNVPVCVPQNVIFVSSDVESDYCEIAKYANECPPNYKYWSEHNCGCGCQWIGEGKHCMETDMVRPNGWYFGVRSDICIDDINYHGEEIYCINGERIATAYEGTCSSPGSICCQYGPSEIKGTASCMFPKSCIPYKKPECAPDDVIFISAALQSRVCKPQLHPCPNGYKYWSELNCGCGCEWIGAGKDCVIKNNLIPHGSFLDEKKNICINETHYIGVKMECINGEEIVEEYEGNCAVGKYPVCCQVGPAGELGAAECYPKNEQCIPYGFQCANDTKVCANGFIARRSVMNNCEFKCPSVLNICGRGIESYRFVAYADRCEGLKEKGEFNCDQGMVEYIDSCGCGCRPRCMLKFGSYFLDFKENCDGFLMCKDGYKRVDDTCGCYCVYKGNDARVGDGLLDDNIEGNGSLNRLSFSFLTLNVFVSMVVCVVLIGVCLSMHYLCMRCGRSKNYDFVGSNDDVEIMQL
eukprot:387560_1